MKEKNICCVIKNSELHIPREKRDFLSYSAAGLCPCTLEEAEDGIALHFESDSMILATAIKSKPKTDKYRLLINIAQLECLHKDYAFSLALDNLVVNRSLYPFILIRDLNCGDIPFLEKYMAVIGDVLTRYKYVDFINGGADLFKKNRLLLELSKLESVAEVKKFLEAEYDKEIAELSKSKKLVSKNNVILSRILIPILMAALICVSFFAIRAIYYNGPHQEQIITASQAYIAGEYIASQNALRNVEPEDMAFETRHFLARAYVITEALTDMQKEHILMGLTRMTDGILFDFWIHIGRLEFDKAFDIAHITGSPDLLLWANMRKYAFIDETMISPGDGEARTEELERLEKEILRLNEVLSAEDDE
ncbi:MAG: hypothetical protein FWD38_06245 [Oscillospiraceae bacterium]|nr:hypothetical protein [Oscillospiraceae bacterium]